MEHSQQQQQQQHEHHSAMVDDYDDDWDDWGAPRRLEERHEPWAAPSIEQMDVRSAYRKAMHAQTKQHRRLTPAGAAAAANSIGGSGNSSFSKNRSSSNGSNGSSNNNSSRINNNGAGRHVLTVLRERELYGSRHCVKRRRPTYPTTISHELRVFGEFYSVTRYHSAFLQHLGGQDVVDEQGARPASSDAVSTISIAFSEDSQTMASTHGDHTVKITCCSTGRLLETLEGHPRTPWTVKYHPINTNIVASGCLGFQVRVWDWKRPACLHMLRLDYAIISLSFHPSGHILAVASGSRMHFWDYANHGNRTDSNGATTNGAITEVEQRSMLRCVHFPPDGNSIIVGGMNPNQDDPRRTARGRGGMSGGGISFYLRLWDFDLDSALHPEPAADDPRIPRGAVRLHRKPLANPRTVVPRALLYNDGGFDVSPDGKTLCACAEYWLPDGFNNAMELLNREQDEYYSDCESVDEAHDARFMGENNTSMADATMSPPAKLKAESKSLTPYLSPPRQRVTRHHPSTNPPPPPAAPAIIPVTPPNPTRNNQLPLSPPSPPGRRWAGGLNRSDQQAQSAGATGATGTSSLSQNHSRTRERHTYALDNRSGSTSSSGAPTPQAGLPLRPPHPLSVITARATYADMTRKPGRYVPHVVTVSLDSSAVPPQCGEAPQLRGQMTSVAKGHRPRLGQLLEACPLDGAKASAVTCVKFAPSADFCLLGYGVREPLSTEGADSNFHPVTALYRVRGGMTHVSTMLSGDDDVNIARFHPDSGYGFVYGTKQGRVRVLSPRPWNYYNL